METTTTTIAPPDFARLEKISQNLSEQIGELGQIRACLAVLAAAFLDSDALEMPDVEIVVKQLAARLNRVWESLEDLNIGLGHWVIHKGNPPAKYDRLAE